MHLPNSNEGNLESTAAHRRAQLLRRAAGAGVVVLSAVAVAGHAWLALPALFLVIVGTVLQRDRWRWLVGILGGALVTVAMLRFTVEWAVPSLTMAGKQAAEERSVSRLREILWAEERVREGKWVDSDGDGVPEYAFLGELTMRESKRSGVKLEVPVLRPEQLEQQSAPAPAVHVYRAEGYQFVVYLPSRNGGGAGEDSADVDAQSAAHRWVAYAWPATLDRGGRRAFYIDQEERICETDNRQAYSGVDKIPLPTAALQGPTLDSTPCGAHTSDGGDWRPWKNKKSLRRSR